jgi:hypothetical protein
VVKLISDIIQINKGNKKLHACSTSNKWITIYQKKVNNIKMTATHTQLFNIKDKNMKETI